MPDRHPSAAGSHGAPAIARGPDRTPANGQTPIGTGHVAGSEHDARHVRMPARRITAAAIGFCLVAAAAGSLWWAAATSSPWQPQPIRAGTVLVAASATCSTTTAALVGTALIRARRRKRGRRVRVAAFSLLATHLVVAVTGTLVAYVVRPELGGYRLITVLLAVFAVIPALNLLTATTSSRTPTTAAGLDRQPATPAGCARRTVISRAVQAGVLLTGDIGLAALLLYGAAAAHRAWPTTGVDAMLLTGINAFWASPRPPSPRPPRPTSCAARCGLSTAAVPASGIRHPAERGRRRRDRAGHRRAPPIRATGSWQGSRSSMPSQLYCWPPACTGRPAPVQGHSAPTGPTQPDDPDGGITMGNTDSASTGSPQSGHLVAASADRHAGLGLRPDIAHSARVYDYWLGGKDNFAADRALAEQIQQTIPEVPMMARANRAFMARATRHLVTDAGIRQILDIGTGIPTSPNLHEVAQGIAPQTRVVYVDNDPLVLVHARAFLTSTSAEGRCAYLDADLTNPHAILTSDELTTTLDLTRPVAVTFGSILMLLPHHADPWSTVATLMDAMPAGSYLIISHPTADWAPDTMAAVAAMAARAGTTFVPRSHQQVARFFTGCQLVEPGLVPVLAWRPDDSPPDNPEAAFYWAGVGRK